MSVLKGVYCLTSPSGKKYVGIGCGVNGIAQRWNSYKRLDCKQQPRLYRALKKYGPDNFIYDVLFVTDDMDCAKSYEVYLINAWNLQNNQVGYNISEGGDGGRFNKGKIATPSQRVGLSHGWNRVISENERSNMSKRMKGIAKTPEHRKSLSNTRIVNGIAKGSKNPRAKRLVLVNKETNQEYASECAKDLVVELGMSYNGFLCAVNRDKRSEYKGYTIKEYN